MEVYYLYLGVYIMEYKFMSSLLVGGEEGANIIGLIAYN